MNVEGCQGQRTRIYMSNLRNKSVVWDNVFYQYKVDNKLYWRSFLRLLRDLTLILINFIINTPKSEKVIFNDTRAANIPQYINFIQKKTYKPIDIMQVFYDDYNKKYKGIIIYFGLSLLFILFLISLPLHRNDKCRFAFFIFCLIINVSKFRLRRKRLKISICFYEKSLISMLAYAISEKFIVIQHGMPSATYWPSIADLYFTWGPKFTEMLNQEQGKKFKTLGAPFNLFVNRLTRIENEKYNVLFLSQMGSSEDLKNEVERAKKILRRSSSYGISILWRCHPNEAAPFNLPANIHVSKEMDLDMDLRKAELIVSTYSTSLLLAANAGYKVSTLNSGARIPEFDLLRELGIPNICEDILDLQSVNTGACVPSIFSPMREDLLDDL